MKIKIDHFLKVPNGLECHDSQGWCLFYNDISFQKVECVLFSKSIHCDLKVTECMELCSKYETSNKVKKD